MENGLLLDFAPELRNELTTLAKTFQVTTQTVRQYCLMAGGIEETKELLVFREKLIPLTSATGMFSEDMLERMVQEFNSEMNDEKIKDFRRLLEEQS
ncbi:hypothetical protein ACFRAM_01400 [Paenibacillus sp. NPDC056722]|uniref:hypothetical protein n=1 Tax=Paenibacillus sp. NPDC056722 TaxID=3345924 RepID=UPI0036836A6F